MLKKGLRSVSKINKVYKKNILSSQKYAKNYASEVAVAEQPLSAFFSGTPEPESSEAGAEVVLQKDHSYDVTTLDNGFKIQSTEFNQCGTTLLSLVVKAGSRYETYENSGVSHFIQRFFFDSTNTRSKMRLVTEMQKTGGTVSSSADRENIIYRSESIRQAVPKLLTLMSDSVLQGRLHEWDLFPIKELVKQDLKDYAESPNVLLNEALHRTAFNSKNLGNPLLCPSYNVNNITVDDVIEAMDNSFTPERMTLVGTNIHHDDLSSLAYQLFGEFPEGTNQSADGSGDNLHVGQSEYSGGDFQMHQSRSGLTEAGTHSVLAFRGVHFAHKDIFALEVLRNLLGEASPLKSKQTFGTQSVLRQKLVNALSTTGQVTEAAAFNINYSDDGLFGVKFAGESGAVGESINKAVGLFEVIADKGVCEMNLNRGKNKAKFNFLSNLETSVGTHEANLAYPNLNREQFVYGLEAVTAEDISRVAGNLLKNKPTLVSYGELANVPTLHDLSFKVRK